MPCLAAAAMARSSQSKSYWPSLGSMRLQANSPTRTMWMPACCIRARSASHRDSGHCSGYHAVPSRMGGGGGAAVCAIAGVSKSRMTPNNVVQEWNRQWSLACVVWIMAGGLYQLPWSGEPPREAQHSPTASTVNSTRLQARDSVYDLPFDSAEYFQLCTLSRRCTPLRRRLCRTPQTTAEAVHIVSSIKTRTDANEGQTADPARSPAMLLAFAIVSTTVAN